MPKFEVGDMVWVNGTVTGRHIGEGLSKARPYRIVGIPDDWQAIVQLEGIPTPCISAVLRKDEFLTAAWRATHGEV